MLKRLIFALLPLAVMGLIFYFSSQPYENQDMRPSMNLLLPLEVFQPLLEPIRFIYHGQPVSMETHGVAGMLEFFIRKAAHLTVFFLLMVTLFMALHTNTKWRPSVKLITSYIITVLYACFDEFHQSLTPNRTPYIGDVVLDSIGGLIGVLLILFMIRRKV